MFDPVRVFTLISRLIVLFTVIPAHECAHGWAANRLGDDTAKRQGRLTLNPFRHFDLFGSILMIFTGFGWAKPVPVNPARFQKCNRKTGMALTALAGPAANLLMALLLLLLCKWLQGGWLLLYSMEKLTEGVSFFLRAVVLILYGMVSINVSLAVFNLLPIPPLDGSRILSLLLPEKLYFQVMRYERFLFLGLFLLLFLGVLDEPLYWMQKAVLNGLDRLTGFAGFLVF